jgi:hypothetical protein
MAGARQGGDTAGRTCAVRWLGMVAMDRRMAPIIHTLQGHLNMVTNCQSA